MRTTIQIIQKIRAFFNFGWVEEREKRVEKKKSSRHLTAAFRSTRVGRDKAPLCLRWWLSIF
jgi:hypothetical protein